MGVEKMAELFDFYGMFDYQTGDTDTYKYTSDEFAILIKALSGNGVSKSCGDEFTATASGLQLTVGSGACFIEGHYAENEEEKTFTVIATASGTTRKDRLVARLDKATRYMELDIKTGSASAFPALVNTETIAEIPLYGITVSNGSTITLTDERILTYSAISVQQAINEVIAMMDAKANVSHTHSISSGTTGTLSIARGGTGKTTADEARVALGITPENIGAAAAQHTHNYAGSASAGGAANSALKLNTSVNLTIGDAAKPFNGENGVSWTVEEIGAAAANHTHTTSQLTGTIPVANGGTGATTPAEALVNLGIIYSTSIPPVVNGAIWLNPVG